MFFLINLLLKCNGRSFETCEVLETLNMNLKKCYCSIYFLKPADQLVNSLRFLEKRSRDISHDLSIQILYLKITCFPGTSLAL